MNNKQCFANELKRLRNKFLLLQDDFSVYADIPISTVKRIESGVNIPSITTFKKIVKYYQNEGVSKEEINRLTELYSVVKTDTE